ncbi:cellulose synthase [Roseibium algae]|uniref:Cellulose synthase n=1 Tax=Roseibium algae TaxID=3123038 RepID=A0ABU8TI15_9HYPH
MKSFLLPVLMLGVGFSAHAVMSADQQSPDNEASEKTPSEVNRIVLPNVTSASKSSNGSSTETTKLSPADLAGLQFFAQSGDTARLNKEIKRLQALYPNWTPPKDPASLRVETDPEQERMWALFKEEKFPELRKLIKERKQSEPGWTAPKDLLEKLATAEARERIANAFQLEQYATVIRIAANNPALLTCANVDTMWQLAEAFAKQKLNARAKDAYLYVLKNCDVPSERLSTIRKAITLLPDADIDQLIAEEKLKTNQDGDFKEGRDDLARLNIFRSLNNGKPAAQADLKTVVLIANKDKTAKDALLLGWYFLEQKNFLNAESWFQTASKREQSEEASEGLGLSLVGLGKASEAEVQLRPWWKASARSLENYLAAASAILAKQPREKIDADVFKTIAEAVTKAKDAPAAQQIAWYAYELGQIETASQWFQVALMWDPKDEEAAYGLALSYEKLDDHDKLEALVADWSKRSLRIAALYSPAKRPASRTARAGTNNRSGRASSGAVSSGCSSFVPPATLAPASALSRGWCLLNKNRALEAADVFSVALSGGNAKVRSDAAYGQSLAYLRLGLVNKAAVSATQARLSPERTRELNLDLLAKRASNAFEAGRYTETLIALDERRLLAPEQLDLMLLRGYAFTQMGRYDDALQIFEALAASGYSDGKKGIYNVVQLQKIPNMNDDD